MRIRALRRGKAQARWKARAAMRIQPRRFPRVVRGELELGSQSIRRFPGEESGSTSDRTLGSAAAIVIREH
jgi:hypothetical protein